MQDDQQLHLLADAMQEDLTQEANAASPATTEMLGRTIKPAPLNTLSSFWDWK